MRKLEELLNILPEEYKVFYDDIIDLFDTYVYFKCDYLYISIASWENLFVNIVLKIIKEEKKLNKENFSALLIRQLNIAIGNYIRKCLTNKDVVFCNNLLIKLEKNRYKDERLIVMFILELQCLNINFSDYYFNLLKENSQKFRDLIDKTGLSDMKYEEFIVYLNKKFKMNVPLEEEMVMMDSEFLTKYSDMSIDQLKKLLGEYNLELREDDIDLLERFFAPKIRNTWIFYYECEKQLNLLLYKYKRENVNISKRKLKQFYTRNKNSFNAEETLYLRCYVFETCDKAIFEEKYPNTRLSYSVLIDKLEIFYFGIDELFDYSLTKEQYLEVLESYPEKIDDTIKDILDCYFGVNGKELSMLELASKYEVSVEVMRSRICFYREKLLALLCNLDNKLEINKYVYLPYVLDKKYELKPLARKVLFLLLEKNLSYEKIAEILNKEKTCGKDYVSSDVAVLVSQGIAKIDTYRFGIDKPIKFTKEMLDKYFNDNKNEIIEKVIRLKYLDFMTNDDIALSLGMDKAKINRIVGDFNTNYILYEIKDVQISISDIEEEIERHIVDSVISDQEKEIISFYYGIKSKFNLDGEKLTSKEINAKLGIKGDTSRKVKAAVHKIKRRKIGDITPELIYIDRNKLEKILEDKHLPISRKDRELICYLMEFDGYPLKSCEDLVDIFNINEKSIKRKYQMAIININKYLSGEKEGVINYEEDILPNLKYFTSFERMLIDDYYRAELSSLEIANKYDLSINKVVGIMFKIKTQLSNIVKGNTERMFDFDYYYEVIDREDLPFYGDRKLAKRIFDLYVQEKLSLEKIKESLELRMSTNAILNIFKRLLLSVFEYKEGIRKENVFSLEEVKEFYLENKDKLSSDELKLFQNYFDKAGGLDYRLSEDLTFLLLKSKYPNYYRIDDLSKKDAIKFLIKYRDRISKKCRDTLMNLKGITERELMSNKEIEKVLQILSDFEQRNYRRR